MKIIVWRSRPSRDQHDRRPRAFALVPEPRSVHGDVISGWVHPGSRRVVRRHRTNGDRLKRETQKQGPHEYSANRDRHDLLLGWALWLGGRASDIMPLLFEPGKEARLPTIYVLEHAEPETSGLIGDVLEARGVELERVLADRGERIPASMDGHAGLLVMGGPMGVYESDRHPHLLEEIRLVRQAVEAAKPVLGICLGSQLVAAGLGAAVRPHRKEVGWHEVKLTDEATRDPLWKEIDSPLEVLHWHGDAFDLPPNARHLASSALTPYQAFGFGENVYGILFHMEMDEGMIETLADRFPADLAKSGTTREALLSRMGTALPEMRRVGRVVFDRWAALLR